MMERRRRHCAELARGSWLGLTLVLLVGASPAFGQGASKLVEAGRQLFVEQGCHGCHTVGKVGTQGIAPDLSQVGAKHDLAYLTKWLQDPLAQRPTAHMPKIQMSEPEVDALAAYLSSLR